MHVVGVILITILFIGIYIVFGIGVFALMDNFDIVGSVDPDDYALAIIMLWPIFIILLILIGIAQIVVFVKDIIEGFK